MMLERRQFLRGLFAAPVIIKLAPLMRLSVFDLIVPADKIIYTDYVFGRLNVLYSYLYVQPEWAVSLGET
jgi:hypothetical protein